MPHVCYTLAQRRAKPCAFCLWRIQKPLISGEARQSPKQKRLKKPFRFQTWFNLRVLFLQRSKEREPKRMNSDDKEETKMKTKMKVAVCTLLCMTMACAVANAEGGTTNSTNSGRPQTQQSQMKNRKEKERNEKVFDCFSCDCSGYCTFLSGSFNYRLALNFSRSARKFPRVSSNHQKG